MCLLFYGKNVMDFLANPMFISGSQHTCGGAFGCGSGGELRPGSLSLPLIYLLIPRPVPGEELTLKVLTTCLII